MAGSNLPPGTHRTWLAGHQSRHRARTQIVDDSDDEEPPRRAGRARAPPARYRAERDLDCGPTGRPTAGERRKANDLIDAMLHLKMLRGKAACVTTNLIALAVAWSENRISFDACAASDNNRLFGLPPRCETHRDWVDDVQRRIAQAQEYLALDTHDRLNFRPTLWTAAELAEHRTQGVPALVPLPAGFPIVDGHEQHRSDEQAVLLQARAGDGRHRAARSCRRRRACGIGMSVSTLLGTAGRAGMSGNGTTRSRPCGTRSRAHDVRWWLWKPRGVTRGVTPASDGGSESCTFTSTRDERL